MARDAILGVEVVFKLRDEVSAPADKVKQKTQEMGQTFNQSETSLRRVANSLGIVGLGLGQVGALLEKSGDAASQSTGKLLTYVGAAISGIGAIVQFVYAIQTLAKAFKSLATAEAIASAFGGPIGWGKLAAGIALGAGAGIAIDRLVPFANGGIVNKPTMALIGESGPEAVVPLRGNVAMGTVNIVINAGASVIDERSLNQFAIVIGNRLTGLRRLGMA